MCTGIVSKSKENHGYFARTQEFAMALPYVGVNIPKGQTLTNTLYPIEFKHTVMGMSIDGSKLGDGGYLFVDACNDAGLAGGMLYFNDYAVYGKEEDILKANKHPLLGEEMVTWMLANCGSLDEIIEKSQNEIALCDTLNAIGQCHPFHFLFSDNTGRSIVLEPTAVDHFDVYENPVNTFTNSPRFDWHLDNLQNYVISYQQTNRPPVQFGDMEVRSPGYGTGMHGLPGDFTPQSRFLRAAWLNNTGLDKVTDENAVDRSFHILNQFDVPKHSMYGRNGDVHFTQYTSVYDLNNKIMYLKMYDDSQIQRLKMRDSKEIELFEVVTTQQYHDMKKI